jgi:ATP-binding protein involved in chromosome partitioning
MLQDPVIGIPAFGIIENMAWFTPTNHPEEKYFLFGKGGGELLSETCDIPLIAQIPINETICASCDGGKLGELFKDSEVKAGFDCIIDHLIGLNGNYTE